MIICIQNTQKPLQLNKKIDDPIKMSEYYDLTFPLKKIYAMYQYTEKDAQYHESLGKWK